MNKATQAVELLYRRRMPSNPTDLQLIELCNEFGGSIITYSKPYRWIHFDDCSDIVFNPTASFLVVDETTNNTNYWPTKYLYLTNKVEGIFTVIYDATLAAAEKELGNAALCLECMWQGAIFLPCSEHK